MRGERVRLTEFVDGLVVRVGCVKAFMQLAGTHEAGHQEVASAHPGSPSLGDQSQTGGWLRWFEPKRSVWAMLVVVLDIDP